MPVSLIVTVAVAIIILSVTAGVTARHRSIRALVMGLGLAAVPVGLFLTGVTDLTINGVISIIDWFRRTPFTTVTGWGIGLAAGGIVLTVIGAFLPKGKGAPAVEAPRAKEVRPKGGAAKEQQAIAGSRPQQPSAAAAPAPAAQPGTGRPAAQKGLDPEDAEIEALLRKRGIM